MVSSPETKKILRQCLVCRAFISLVPSLLATLGPPADVAVRLSHFLLSRITSNNTLGFQLIIINRSHGPS